MEYLRGPLYLDVAAKGLSLAGVVLMIFAEGGWFTVGMFMVSVGVLIGAWAVFAARRVRSQSGPARPAPFGAWNPGDAAPEKDSKS